MAEPDVEIIIQQATEVVAGSDWLQWQPEPDEALLYHRHYPHFPPLTTRVLQTYLDFYAWVWRRTPGASEGDHVKQRLLEIWNEDTLLYTGPPDFSRMNAIWSRVLLLAYINRRSPAEQDVLRAAFQRLFPAGEYPELAMFPGSPKEEAQAQPSPQPARAPRFDAFYARLEQPRLVQAPLPSGMSMTVTAKWYYFGLNNDGFCQRGQIFFPSGGENITAEGSFTQIGDHIQFSWSNGAQTTGRLSDNDRQLTVDGEIYQLGEAP